MPKQDNSLKSIIPGAAIGARVQKSKRLIEH